MNGIRKLQEKLRERGLGKIASRVGTAALVGGPGGAAGAVLSEVASALGAPSSDPEVLYQAVAHSSEADLVALRQIEAEADRVREEEQTKREAIRSEDVQDARATFKGVNPLQWVIAISVLILNAGVLYALFRVPIPQENAEVVYIFAGALLTAFNVVVAYFFGSSAGSAMKTNLLGK